MNRKEAQKFLDDLSALVAAGREGKRIAHVLRLFEDGFAEGEASQSQYYEGEICELNEILHSYQSVANRLQDHIDWIKTRVCRGESSEALLLLDRMERDLPDA